MSLQKRLTCLLAAFVVFALVASFGTVYSIQLHVENAISSFQHSMDQTVWLDRLHLEAREQYIELRDIADGVRPADESYLTRRNAFLTKLQQVADFAFEKDRDRHSQALSSLRTQLDREFERCLVLVDTQQRDRARAVLADRIGSTLIPALDACLLDARGYLDQSRNRSVDRLVAANTQVLMVATVVGVLGIGLVAVGTVLVRRWVILPIGELHEATQKFADGKLDFRLEFDAAGELGALAGAMNGMAGSLAQVQTELQASETKYRSLFENLRDATVICDAQGRVLECHDGDTRLLGTVERNCTGLRLQSLWSRWRSEILDWPSLIERVLREGTQVRVVNVALAREEGNQENAAVDLVAYPVEFRDARCVAIVLRDVTERTVLERRARRAEAMEATATFARGVAHDFNNLLTSAIGTLSLVDTTSVANELAERLRRALRACWQAAGLSRKLLDFASGGQGHPQVLCLRETVELILQSFEEDYWDGVRVHTEWGDIVNVEIDRDQLTQIVLNLIRNARDAMPDGGDLHIKVDSTRIGAQEAASGPPTHALLTVTDTGVGLTPEVKERLFEPFFTTKPHPSQRTRGLGLAIVHSAVRKADGSIEVDGEPGVGTTFRVFLPLARGVPEKAGSVGIAPPVTAGGGTILLVDDEPMVLQFCVDAFSSWGYRVLTADCIEAARRSFTTQESGRIALAVINLELPDGTGVDLASEFIRTDPGLRVVFMTGLTFGEIPRELEGRVCACLSKPFRLDNLAAAVSAALEPRAGAPRNAEPGAAGSTPPALWG